MRIRMQETGPVGKFITAIVGAILLVLGFMFSIVLIAIVVVVGLGVWGWYWWKTRAIRQQINERMREHAEQPRHAPGGDIIEGEAVVVEEEITRVTSNRLPGSPDRHSPD